MQVKPSLAFFGILMTTLVIANEILSEDFILFLGQTAGMEKEFPEEADMLELVELPMLDKESAAALPVNQQTDGSENSEQPVEQEKTSKLETTKERYINSQRQEHEYA